jgi:murein DD-endopeptidase MepM/ murein hydrolase activator NlpD
VAKTIKTREVTRDIKTRNPAPPVGRQMKQAALKAKDAAARQVQEPQGGSSNEYAGNAIEEKAKAAARDTVQTADSRGRTAITRTHNKAQKLAQKRATKKPAPETPPVDASNAPCTEKAAPGGDAPAQSTAPDKAQAQKRKAQQKKKASQQHGRGKADKSAPDASGGENGKPGQPKRKIKNDRPKQKPGRTIGRVQKSAKTAAQGARQTQQAVKTAAKSAKTAQQTAHRARQAAEQAVKAMKAAAKATYKTIKAAIEGTKLLGEAIIAGGWGAVVIILVICLAGFLIASPFGIFFSGSGEQSLPQVVQELSREYYDRFELLQHNYVHDVLSFEGAMSIDWPQVLAVYAVKVVNDPLDPEEVTTFDKKKIDKLRKILNEMNSFTYSVQNRQTSDGIERTLTIHIARKSAAEMAQAYKFNAEQKAQLDELLSPEYASLWALLLGGYVPGSGDILSGDITWVGMGIFNWPMQAGDYSWISSGYGMRDNPTKPGEQKFHNGIDLASDEGKPILAAADGIVEVANSTDSWGYGWGYYVKIKHSGGYETLYAHCSKIGVRENEEVYQGQVIGWIGSTGNSTGDHLHFEVRRDGTRVNPLDYYIPK